MNARQVAANAVVAISIAASMPIALAQDEHHGGDRPEISPGLVRDVRQVTQKFQDVNAATAAGYGSVENCVSGANDAPPVLGGQLFNYVGAPNRLRLPAHYEFHVWAWKRNSSGTFSGWNPRVSCTDFVQ
jgi:hypothetical protein